MIYRTAIWIDTGYSTKVIVFQSFLVPSGSNSRITAVGFGFMSHVARLEVVVSWHTKLRQNRSS